MVVIHGKEERMEGRRARVQSLLFISRPSRGHHRCDGRLGQHLLRPARARVQVQAARLDRHDSRGVGAAAAPLAALAVFLGFSAPVAAHTAGVCLVAVCIFTSERRFNITVGVHCAVLIKRSRDARQLGELLAQHWHGGRAALLQWRLAGWVEGWRAVERFCAEAAWVRLRLFTEGGGRRRRTRPSRPRRARRSGSRCWQHVYSEC